MIVNFVLTLIALLLFAGLGVDAGMLEWRYLTMTTAAKAAATSGALMQQRCAYENCGGSASTDINLAGQATATLNGFTNGANGVTVTIDNPPTAGPYSGNSYSVRATISQSVPTTFMGLGGFSPITLTATYDQPGAAIVPTTTAYNAYAIYQEKYESSIPAAGVGGSNPNNFDHYGNAFSADCLDSMATDDCSHPIRKNNAISTPSQSGAILSWRGNVFFLGPCTHNSPNAWSYATSQVIVTLTSGKFSQLLILASTAWGQGTIPTGNTNEVSATFTVHYSDGSTTSASASPNTNATSDWVDLPATQMNNEVTVQRTAYRISSGGSDTTEKPKIFGYTINLNNSKTVSTVYLPNLYNLRVFAMDLIP